MSEPEFHSSNCQEHTVRKVSPPMDVPVYNCHVFVAPRNDEGVVVARAAALEGVSGRGKSEREALQKIVATFKEVIAAYRHSGEPIPWLDPPLQPADNEQQRWIAVHL